MKITVEFRYDRWEVNAKYGYRETLLAVVASQAEGEKVAAEYKQFGWEWRAF